MNSCQYLLSLELILYITSCSSRNLKSSFVDKQNISLYILYIYILYTVYILYIYIYLEFFDFFMRNIQETNEKYHFKLAITSTKKSRAAVNPEAIPAICASVNPPDLSDFDVVRFVDEEVGA